MIPQGYKRTWNANSLVKDLNSGHHIHFLLQLLIHHNRLHDMSFKRKGVMLHHENARPHTAQLTKDILEELNWEKLLHPLCSYDLWSGYHLFRIFQNHLDGVKLTSKERSYILHKIPQNVYKQSVYKLVDI